MLWVTPDPPEGPRLGALSGSDTKNTGHGMSFPAIDPIGLDGLLVRFADTLSEPANRAALAFRRHVSDLHLPGLLETATSLGGVHLRFDPARLSHAALRSRVDAVLASRDWYGAPLPSDRRLWRIPTVYGGDHGPQLARAADLAEVSTRTAIEALSDARLRILTIGFAPGQPYVGQLDQRWDLPRQTDLATQVPPGALALAVRQFVLFPAESRTGWYHVGQTAFCCFRPDGDPVFPLQPGDEMQFPAISAAEYEALLHSPDGGATCAPID